MAAAFYVPSHVHSRQFDGETVVLNLADGKYFSLDEVGAAVWNSLTDGKTLDEVVAQLVSAYEVDEATARVDVERLSEQLIAAGLLVPLAPAPVA